MDGERTVLDSAGAVPSPMPTSALLTLNLLLTVGRGTRHAGVSVGACCWRGRGCWMVGQRWGGAYLAAACCCAGLDVVVVMWLQVVLLSLC
eukprot:COSAG02_NODE_8372_length_2595_cov_10.989978_2_plen_91_part_00